MTKIGRNAPCPCGSGLKYKRCCEEKDLMADLDQDETHAALEINLSDIAYHNVLCAVWLVFHPETIKIPDEEIMEDFYYEIYGYDLDRDIVDELVLPLPPQVFKNLPAPTQDEGPIIDLEPETGGDSSPKP